MIAPCGPCYTESFFLMTYFLGMHFHKYICKNDRPCIIYSTYLYKKVHAVFTVYIFPWWGERNILYVYQPLYRRPIIHSGCEHTDVYWEQSSSNFTPRSARSAAAFSHRLFRIRWKRLTLDKGSVLDVYAPCIVRIFCPYFSAWSNFRLSLHGLQTIGYL